MTNIWEKTHISILTGNLNSGVSYLIKTVYFLYAVRNKLPIGYFCLLIYFLSLYRGPESGAGGGSGSVGQHYSGNKPPLISGGTVNDNSGGKGSIFLQNWLDSLLTLILNPESGWDSNHCCVTFCDQNCADPQNDNYFHTKRQLFFIQEIFNRKYRLESADSALADSMADSSNVRFRFCGIGHNSNQIWPIPHKSCNKESVRGFRNWPLSIRKISENDNFEPY